MPKKSVYHVSNDHQIHKGPLDKCRRCKRHKKTKTKTEKCKVSGSSGGKKAAATVNTRKCSCGSPIHHQNKSGMCIKCLNEKRRIDKLENKKSKVAVPKRCNSEGCNRKLTPTNQSGLCAKCYQKSDAWRQRRQEHSNWVTTMAFSKDVKDMRSAKGASDA